PRHRLAEERLRRVRHAVAERLAGLPAAGAQVVLVVDEERRTELLGEPHDVVAVEGEAAVVADRRSVGEEGHRQWTGHHISVGAETPSTPRPARRPTPAAAASHQRASRTAGSTSPLWIGQSW